MSGVERRHFRSNDWLVTSHPKEHAMDYSTTQCEPGDGRARQQEA